MLNTSFRSQSILPRLVFGDAFAAEDDSVNDMSDRLSQEFHSILDYSPAQGHDFRHRYAQINVNGLSLFASASTPIRVEVKEAETPCLLVPFYGSHQSIIPGEKRLRWQQDESAVLLPAFGRGGEDGLRSILMIEIDPDRLHATAAGMLGRDDEDAPEFDLEMARTVPLRAGKVHFGQVLRHLCERIDLHHATAGQITLDGLDESVYRVIAMMLRPELFLNDATQLPANAQGPIDAGSMLIWPQTDRAAQGRDKPLSPREFQLLHLLAKGRSYTQISDDMGVSMSTVQSHIRGVYRKLDAHSKTQAIHNAKQRGFI